MNRFRLRFLLQEIDLPQGDTLIGRSAGCQVTLDDPLVSREHARIRISDGQATLFDLGSRNGIHVGGRPIVGPVLLNSGDRIRIGTQELVFLEVPAAPERAAHTRNTGFMCHCANCGRAYPAELFTCPACGSKDRLDEDTLSGSDQQDWGLELAADAVARARASGSLEDLERVLSHARLGLEQRLAEGRSVDRKLVDAVSLAAAELAVARSEVAWGRWALSIYASLATLPVAEVCQALHTLPPAELELLAPAAQRVAESSSTRSSGLHDEARLQALALLIKGTRP